MKATRDSRPGVTHVAGARPGTPPGRAPTPKLDGEAVPTLPAAGLPEGEWYALWVMSNAEFVVADALATHGIEAFLPTRMETTQWSDRKKAMARPLFPGYLFARFEEPRVRDIVRIAGLLEVLPSNLNPMPVDAEEIDAVRRLAASGLPLKVCDYATGDEVTIDSGPLAGIKGVVQRTKNGARVVVKIEILHRAVRVEVDAEELVKEAA